MFESASREQWGRLRADVSRLVGGRLPSRADVEDVVQEVMLRVWKHGADVRDDERFGAWLSRVAFTAAADHMRARQRHPLARYEHEPEVEAGGIGEAGRAPGDDEPNVKPLIAAVLHPFIAASPSPYRETLVMSELEGLSYAVIAEKLGLSVSAVKSRVQRGRHILREMLERCCAIGLDARGTPISCEVRPDAVLPPGCHCQRPERAPDAGAPRPAPDRATPENTR